MWSSVISLAIDIACLKLVLALFHALIAEGMKDFNKYILYVKAGLIFDAFLRLNQLLSLTVSEIVADKYSGTLSW